MRLASTILCAAVALGLCAAQSLDLKLGGLAAKASSKVELDLDSKLLRLAMRASGDADVSGLLSGVQAVHIRTYEFAKPGAYSQADLEPLRNQVAAQSRWSQILNVKEDDETSEIWVAAQGEKVSGCLIVSAAERELSVIYLEGTMALAQMKRLVDDDSRRELANFFGNH